MRMLNIGLQMSLKQQQRQSETKSLISTKKTVKLAYFNTIM